MTVRNLFTYQQYRSFFKEEEGCFPGMESNHLPSNTVPDMSMSIRDMLDKNARGGKVSTFEPVYADSTSHIPVGLENLDKFERWTLSNQIGDFIAAERGKIISARQARQQEINRLAVERAVAERMASAKQAEGKSTDAGGA